MYKGIGNEFRELSQKRLFGHLNETYRFRSVLQAPYDHSTDPDVDNRVFHYYVASKSLHGFPNGSFDLVWNFGFLQRLPGLIREMARVSRLYVLALVPNHLNPGTLVHRLYHRIYGSPCNHPERGHPSLMSLKGLTSIFESAGVRVLEKGYVDAPIWPDTAVTLAELVGSSSGRCLRIPFPRCLLDVERLTMPLGRVTAHYIYCFGRLK